MFGRCFDLLCSWQWRAPIVPRACVKFQLEATARGPDPLLRWQSKVLSWPRAAITLLLRSNLLLQNFLDLIEFTRTQSEITSTDDSGNLLCIAYTNNRASHRWII